MVDPPFGYETVEITSCCIWPLPYQFAYSLYVQGLAVPSPDVMYSGSVYAVLVAHPEPVFNFTSEAVPTSREHDPLAVTLYLRT